MNRSEEVRFTSHAGGGPSLHDDAIGLHRDVQRLRSGPTRRGARRSLFDPNPAISARTIRRRTGICMLIALMLLAATAGYVGFTLLRAVAHMIGGMFAPRIAGSGIVGTIASLWGLG